MAIWETRKWQFHPTCLCIRVHSLPSCFTVWSGMLLLKWLPVEGLPWSFISDFLSQLVCGMQGGDTSSQWCWRQKEEKTLGNGPHKQKCWHKLIKWGILQDWISSWFMATAQRLPGQFFLLIRCCPWFMSESQRIGWLGILAAWMEGRGLFQSWLAPSPIFLLPLRVQSNLSTSLFAS